MTIGIALVILLLLTVSTFYVNRFLLFELKTASNQYRNTQAFEAAEAGLALGAAWLQRRASVLETVNTACSPSAAIPIRSASWGCRAGQTDAQCAADPFEWMQPAAACNAGLPASDTVTLDDIAFEVGVEFRRRKGALAALYTIEILSTAQTPGFDTSLDPFRARASAVETIVLRPLVDPNTPANPNSPLLVKGTVSDVTGTPDICPKAPTDTEINQGNRADCTAGTGQTGVAIATLAPNTSGIDTGSFNTHGGPIIALNAPDKTVHEVLFPGVTEVQVCEVSKWQAANLPVDQRNVFYYGTACAGSPYSLPNKLSPIGTTAGPVVQYVGRSAYSGNGCPGLSPGEYFGVLYIGGDCDGNGWGNVDYYGAIAVEGNLTKFTANTISRHLDLSRGLTGGGGGSVTPGSVARSPGSWRDY
jgi:Tfp pilus assembly protein PilX